MKKMKEKKIYYPVVNPEINNGINLIIKKSHAIPTLFGSGSGKIYNASHHQLINLSSKPQNDNYENIPYKHSTICLYTS